MIQDVNIGAFAGDQFAEEQNYRSPVFGSFQYPIDYTDHSPIRSTIDYNFATAPDGTRTANYLRITSLAGNQLVRVSIPRQELIIPFTDPFFTLSCFFKNYNSACNTIQLCATIPPSNAEQSFSFNGGSAFIPGIKSPSSERVFVKEYPDNWYRCCVTFRNVGSFYPFGFFMDLEGGTKNLNEGILFWGMRVDYHYDINDFVPNGKYDKFFYQ